MSTLENTVVSAESAEAPSTARTGRVLSADGTVIAFDQLGRGPAVILVDGALCSRALGPMPKIARILARRFSVFTYDRRGRGGSGDTAPYAVEREVDDLAALIREAAGSACVLGISSGAVLALTAANRGLPIKKLAMYEAPFIVDRGRPSTESDWSRIDELTAAGDHGGAVKTFLRMVGVPGLFVALMPLMPVWSKAKAIAQTLPHDGALVREYQRGEPLPANRWASVTIPTLVADGGSSPSWMRTGMRSLADILPNAVYRTLPGQTHDVAAKVIAPMLEEFFGAQEQRFGS
jgi:pimeloyl-ACP methyl ester carboxylesterase